MNRRLAVLAVSFCALAVRSEDPPPDPAAQFAAKFAAANQKAAKEFVTLAKHCWSRKLFQHAFEEYAAAVACDPANAEAQKGIGKMLDGDKWVDDPSATVKKKNEGKESDVFRYTEEWKKKREAACEKLAKEFDAIADFAVKAKLDAEAKTAWKRVLDFDTDHEKARKGLGYEKQEGKWVPPEDVAKRKDGAKKIADAGVGEIVEGKTDVENLGGFEFCKRKSKHFFMQGDYTDKEIQELMKVAAGTRTAFLEAFEKGEDDLDDFIEAVFVRDERDHRTFIDKCTAMDERKKKTYYEYGGYATFRPRFFEAVQGGGDWAYVKDICCHDVVHQMFHQYSGAQLNAWLEEGIAYWFTDRLLKSAETHCIDFALSGGGGGGKSWDNVLDWRALVKEMVAQGNPDLKEIMEGPLNSLTAKKGCKAWSVVDFMMTKHRRRFFRFVELLASGEKDEEALKQAFEVEGYSEFDRQWIEFVRATY
jgi:hypothetical protein